MGKGERVLDLFPAFYRADEPFKLLAYVVGRLAATLDQMDGELFRIQHAHRMLVAENALDIVRLAALLNLAPFHFEDILESEELDYEQKLALLRQRVQEVARLHLEGLGTPRAVMEVAALFLNGRLVPEDDGGPLIRNLDAEGFSHRALVAFDHLPGEPRETIYLHENPYRRRKESPAPRWPGAAWNAHNGSVAPAPARFVIQGVEGRTVLPTIYCPESQQGFFFNGVVPADAALVIDADDGATLDGRPVDPWLIFLEGGVYDGARGRQHNGVARLDPPSGPPRAAGGAAAVDAPRATVPTVPTGRSQWRLAVREGRYNGAVYDYAVYTLPELPVGVYEGERGYDNCVYDYPPSAVAGMAWDERVSCAFKLLLPAYLPGSNGDGEEGGDGGGNPIGRVGEIMPRFRPAGIQSFVDRAEDGWVLGQSIIRAADAGEGEGATYHATRLVDPRAELLIS